MATQPTDFPDWTDGSPTKVVQPNSPQTLSGWTSGEPPPFQYANWLQYNVGLWVRWFDFITSPANQQAAITGNTTGTFPTRTYFANPTGGTFTFTFPLSTSVPKSYRITVKHIGLATSNSVNLAVSGSDQLEGGTTGVLNKGDVLTFETDGVSNWWQV